ncbi:isoprenylcysteine carboxylmethyltransferase family protein [Corallincola spongiicola]|uniref:Isoprenylcysteine carboxylmethyltransferase family protein n=2 Tax=Corallincola spongiicola TaxID=2520508 RepID=A0ABY1WPC7_9GAMM|nr:isoprenylcysteine carboxylmethyltransferase family protein [Corallincola spongiicola]
MMKKQQGWIHMPVPLAILVAVLMALSCACFDMSSLVTRTSFWLGFALCLLAASICVAAVISFRRAKTTVDPRFPEQSNQLVVAGVFNYSRNPMYVGFVIALFAWVLILGNPWTLLWVVAYWLFMDRYQIRHEEQALEKKFGESYREYCQRVRRWV